MMFRGFLSLSLMVFVAACGKGSMNAKVITQSGVPSAMDQSSTTTTTTTTKSEETTTTSLKAPVVETPTSPGDEYPDQVSRANHHRTTTTTLFNPEGFDPAKLAPGTVSADFTLEGEITPTVYYNAIINDDKTCTDEERVTLHGAKAVELAKVCPSTLNYCGLQGSCTVVSKGTQVSYNVINRYAGVDHFMVLNVEECPFGLGVRSICLDPFYTVAADLKIYKPGDVIFIPQLVGFELFMGRKHTGFFVVRDKGRDIVGKGRFDFFSGFYSWRDQQNPFAKAKLNSSKTKMMFYKVTGKSAESVLSGRMFPGLPTIQKPK